MHHAADVEVIIRLSMREILYPEGSFWKLVAMWDLFLWQITRVPALAGRKTDVTTAP